MNCLVCQAEVSENGLADCGQRVVCNRDRETFEKEVAGAKAIIDLLMLGRMEKNEMPECFQFTRATGVALAQLAMDALLQNQSMALMLKNLGHDLTKPKH